MARRDDRLDELERWKKQREIEVGIQDGISKRVRAICVTATSVAIGAFYTFGQWAYEKWEALEAAIRAFISINRGGQ